MIFSIFLFLSTIQLHAKEKQHMKGKRTEGLCFRHDKGSWHQQNAHQRCPIRLRRTTRTLATLQHKWANWPIKSTSTTLSQSKCRQMIKMLDEGVLAEKLRPHCLLICNLRCNHVNESAPASKWQTRKVSYFYHDDANEDATLCMHVCGCVRENHINESALASKWQTGKVSYFYHGDAGLCLHACCGCGHIMWATNAPSCLTPNEGATLSVCDPMYIM